MPEDRRVLEELLARLRDLGGSDLLLSVGAPAAGRIDGKLQPLGNSRLTRDDIEKTVQQVTTDVQRRTLETERELDFSFNWRDRARLRANVFYQRGTLAVALRLLPYEIPTVEGLALPKACVDWSERSHGFVLVVGPTGSGRSTTLAALVNRINTRRPVHIVTVEDPIEYLYAHSRAVVNQREVGSDAHSFARGIRAALREAADVVLVGELRDMETTQEALTAADTGHLVFATLHTNDAAQSIDRVIDMFPAEDQQRVRLQLANSLVGIVYQQLLPRKDGGRVAAHEVLVATPAVRALIRDGASAELRTAVRGGAAHGMQSIEKSLNDLVAAGVVAREEAVQRASEPLEIV